jgi:4-hydroxy-3-methylbut-2-en-1-yl diphosphate reductase
VIMEKAALAEPKAQFDEKILLANPRGFCAGVARAIDIVESLLEQHGAPLYVRKEIVHNREVVEDLRARGVIFVDDLNEVPEGAVAVFSAHGVAPSVREQAAGRNLHAIDATCPLVSKVHREATRFAEEGLFVLLVGHRDHDEVVGTLGHLPGRIALVEDEAQAETVTVPDPARVAVVSQTTLSLDEVNGVIDVLRKRFPDLREPARSDICYATQNRQVALKELAREVDVVVVVGSQNSSNSQRLRECSEQLGVHAILIDDPAQIDPAVLAGAKRVGVTAGASSPEALVKRVIERIQAICGDLAVEEIGRPEPPIAFPPPRGLVARKKAI